MFIRIIKSLIIFSICISFFSGCVLVNSDFIRTKNLILSELDPAHIETEIQVQIGPGILSMGELVVSFTDAKEEAIKYMRDLHKIQIGVYKIHDIKNKNAIKIPQQVFNNLYERGFMPIVKVKERNSAVTVMTRLKGQRLSSMYIIALEKDELVVVQLEGRLERIIEKAIKEHGLKKGEFINI